MLVLTACSASSDVGDAYASDLQEAKERATSSFEKRVLEDLEISRAEYQEAVDRYVTCMHDAGVSISAMPVSQYFQFQIANAPPDLDQISDGCRKGTLDLIEPIYVNMLTNPAKQDIHVLRLSCLVRHGVVAADFTVDDLKRAEKDNFAGTKINPEDPAVQGCYADASQ